MCVSAIGFNPVELGKEAPLCCEGKNTSFYEIINVSNLSLSQIS